MVHFLKKTLSTISKTQPLQLVKNTTITLGVICLLTTTLTTLQKLESFAISLKQSDYQVALNNPLVNDISDMLVVEDDVFLNENDFALANILQIEPAAGGDEKMITLFEEDSITEHSSTIRTSITIDPFIVK